MRRHSALYALLCLLLPAPLLAQRGKVPRCDPDNGGIKLPPGFCATVFADSVPGARAMAVLPNGDVIVARLGRAGGVIALRDADRDGHAERREDFASGFTTSHVALFDKYLYTEALPPRGPPGSPPRTIAILRYPLEPGELTPSGSPDTIVAGLPGDPGHSTRNFAITRDGVMYVNVGSPSNSCQLNDRAKEVPGKDPCAELDTRAGIWRFDARKQHQTQSMGDHFARGIRNAVGIAINPADGRVWTTQHGRDDLGGWWKQLGLDSVVAIRMNAETPGEELFQVNRGEDFGWPYCYFDPQQKEKMLAPEYGGDGKLTTRCADKKSNVAHFPAHWAPNALLFYSGTAFPAKYKNGAFIAFHGSWNRAPEPQGGYNVVFQPMKNGKRSGAYEVFADNFSPNLTTPGTRPGMQGTHRPAGLAQGPDGALYISEDTGGRILKVVYTGGSTKQCTRRAEAVDICR